MRAIPSLGHCTPISQQSWNNLADYINYIKVLLLACLHWYLNMTGPQTTLLRFGTHNTFLYSEADKSEHATLVLYFGKLQS